MERLIEDAEKLDSSFHATRDSNGQLTLSFDDIVNAIHIVQENMGITGTTAEEASGTISGSVASMKAAWENLLVGLSSDTGDFEVLVDNFIDSLIGMEDESGKRTGGVIDNVMPKISAAISGIGELVKAAVPAILEMALDNPELIALVLGIGTLKLVGSAIVTALSNGLAAAGPALAKAIKGAVSGAATSEATTAATTAAGTSVGTEFASATGIALSAVLPAAIGAAVFTGGFVVLADAISGIAAEVERSKGIVEYKETMGELSENTTSAAEAANILSTELANHLPVYGSTIDSLGGVAEQSEYLYGILESSGGDWYAVAEAMGYTGTGAYVVSMELQNLYGELWNTAQGEQAAAEGADNLATSTQDLGTTTSSVLPDLATQYENTFGITIPDTLQSAVIEAESKGIEIPQTLVDGIMDGSVSVQDAADQLAGLSVPQVDEEEVGKVGFSVPTKLSQSLKDSSYLAEDEAGAMADRIINEFSDTPDEMYSSGDDSGAEMANGIGAELGTVKSKLSSMNGYFKSEFKDVATTMSSTGLTGSQKLAEAIGSGSDSQVVPQMSRMANAMVSAMYGVPSEMYYAGSMAGQGLYNGLSGWAGAVSSLAWSIANSINAAARAALKVSSPSRVMMEVGEYTAEGLAIGLDNGTEMVASSAQSMALAAIGATEDVMALTNADMVASTIGTVSADVNTLVSGSADLNANINGTDSVLSILANLYNAVVAISKMQMVVDSNAVVGALAEPMNKAFAELQTATARG